MKPTEVLEYAKENGAKLVDLKFIDLPGIWQHTTVTIAQLKEDSFVDGFGLDGSSIRGWQPIDASDMLIIPDATTAKMDPFATIPTLSLIGDIADPITRASYSRDPRNIAKKAEKYLKSTGIADICYFGPEAEFFIFDDIRFDSQPNRSFYYVDSVEGRWNTGREEAPNLGYKPAYKGGYFPVPPTDSLNNLRAEIVQTLVDAGIYVEVSHHEVATGGQCEIDMRFLPLTQMADTLMWFKYIVKNVAVKNGKTATFMPKPLYGDNGSGMHCHQSLWKNESPLFAGNGYAGVSETCLYYIGGIIKHAKSICAFTNPTTNSYRRLTPGFEAPVNLAYSSRNRSAAIRIPMISPSPKSKRIEFRTPDPSSNPYLAFAAMMLAGLDGIEKRIHPGEPLDKDLYSLSPEELSEVPSVPHSLDESLKALRADYEYLLKGDVFTPDVLDTWIQYKKNNEIDPVRLRPVPLEFALYYDC